MTYRLQDLIDMEQFQGLQDRLNEIYSFPSAIIDNEGNILTATAWQDVCTKFHRKNTESEKECIKSDLYITEHLSQANPAVSYRCPHGFIDNATPIIIDGRHLGNFFTGQFLLQEPDLDFFRRQAARYGFDETAYIEAVRRVPVWTMEQLNSYLFFIKGLIEVIASIGLKNLKVMEAGRSLRESEERHRTIIRTAMDGFWLADRHGRLLQVNDAYCRMSGYRAEELLAMNISDVEVAEDRAATERHVRKLLAEGQDRFESRHRRKDGTEFDVEVSAQYHTMGDGCVVAFLHDITERKRTEEALRSREAFIRNILESVDEEFIVVDRGYRVLSANRAFCGHQGVPEEEVIGRKCHELSHGLATPCFENGEECPIRQTFETGLSYAVTHRHRDADGGLRFLEIKSYPVTDGSGRVVSVIETSNDVTETRKLEEQLRQAQKMEAIGTLAGGVAHDFNNLLTAIMGYGTIIKMKMAPGDPQQASIDQILEASGRAARLTQGLLAFSRKQAINTRPVDVNGIVRNVESLLRRVIGEDIDLTFRLAAGELNVMADAGQVEQVLMNLAVNARDAMPEGGAFIITTEEAEAGARGIAGGAARPGRHVLISVSDTGEGMDEKTREKIFEPFFTTKEPGRGTGLGLAIVYGIIKQHDGTISVYSEPGRGTTFRIYLPAISEAAERPATAGANELPARGSETILLAEDEESVRRLVGRTLEEFGYRVIAAGDGQEAIEKFAAHVREVDFVILDVIMPKKSGREVHDAVRAIRPGMDVLFISGYTGDVITKKGIFEAGIELMSKPLNPYALLGRIREMLDRKKR